MLNRAHNTAKHNGSIRMMVILLIAILLFGTLMPDYTAFADNEEEQAKAEAKGGLTASQQVEDETSESKASKEENEEHKDIDANDQVEDEINKNAEKKETKKASSADEQVEDGEETDDYEAEIKGFKVNVSVPEGTFNDDVKLSVKEAVIDKKDAINDEKDVVELTNDQIRAIADNGYFEGLHLDIAFIDGAGKEVEPDEEAEVSIKVDKSLITDKKNIDPEDIRVGHLVEGKKGEVKTIKEVAGGETETSKITFNKKAGTVKVEFVSDSFSVYTLNGNDKEGEMFPFWFYFLDKYTMDEPAVIARNDNLSSYNFLPELDQAARTHFISGVDYSTGMYVLQKRNAEWQTQKSYYIVPPFGYVFDKAKFVRKEHDTVKARFENSGAEITKAAYTASDHWQFVQKGQSNWQDPWYWSDAGNENRTVDYVATYERLELNELPIYPVYTGTTTRIKDTLQEVINDSVFTRDFKTNGKSVARSDHKYTIGLNGVFTAFEKTYSDIGKGTSANEYYNLHSAYITTEGKYDSNGDLVKTPIKSIRYEGDTNLWYYFDASGNKIHLTSNNKVYIEFDAESNIPTGDHLLWLRDGDSGRNESVLGGDGDYKEALTGRDGKEYIDLDTYADTYKIDFANDKVTVGAQDKGTLMEAFGITKEDYELYAGFIRHTAKGNIDGPSADRIEYIERANGKLYIKMVGKDKVELQNKTTYALFCEKVELETVDTIDSAAMGFHVHMFNFPRSALLEYNDANSWAAEYAQANTTGDGRPGETELGLYSNTTFGASGTSYSEKFPYVQKIFRSTGTVKWFEEYGESSKDANSLAKLFAPVSSNKNYVGEANNLFLRNVYDKTGYIYYNSEDNAAVLNDKGSNGYYNFDVYKALMNPVQHGDPLNTQNSSTLNFAADSFFYRRGNFMPFNDIDTSLRYSKNMYDASGFTWPNHQESVISGDVDNKDAVARDETINIFGIKEGRVKSQATPDYFHGMYAYMNFYQPKNGLLEELPNGKQLETKQPMVYEFTGDDDMMVYIDGVLVLDLGGVHDAQSGSINFATGEVKYSLNGYRVKNAQGETEPVIDETGSTSIKAQFAAAGKNVSSWTSNTLPDNTYHTIQIFYMERGCGASNLKINVNIPPVPDAFFTVEKEVEKVEGVDKTDDDEKEKFKVKLTFLDETTNKWRPITEIPSGYIQTVEEKDGTYEEKRDSKVEKYYIEGDPDTYYDIASDGTVWIEDGQRICIPGVSLHPITVKAEEISSNKHDDLSPYYRTTYKTTVNGVIVGEGDKFEVDLPVNKTSGAHIINTPKVPTELTKVNLDGTPLNGAEFALLEAGTGNKNGRDTVYVKGTRGDWEAEADFIAEANCTIEKLKLNTTPIVSGNDGKITIPGGLLEPSKQYLLLETKAPYGYKKAVKPWLVTVSETGIARVSAMQDNVDRYGQTHDSSPDDHYPTTNNVYKTWWWKDLFSVSTVNEENNTIELKNEPITLVKTTSSGTELLKNAEFVLNDVELISGNQLHTTDNGIITYENKTPQNGGTIITATSGDDGAVDISEMVRYAMKQGKGLTGVLSGKRIFMLYETSAPTGYKLATAPWAVIVDEATGAIEIRQYSNRYAKPLRTETGINGKYWNVNDYSDANILSDKVLKNDLEPMHKIIKVDGTTIPTDDAGNYKQSLSDAEVDLISKLGNARFRVIESKAQETRNGHIIFKDLEVVQDDGKDLILDSANDGTILLPRSLNPSANQTARYFLLEEIDAPTGYVKPTKPFAVRITRAGIENATQPVVDADEVFIVNSATVPAAGQSWADIEELDCADIGSGKLPYAVIPNEPIRLTKVNESGNGVTEMPLANAKFVAGDVQNLNDGYYQSNKAGLIKDNEGNIIELISDSEGKIDISDVLRNLASGQGTVESGKITLLLYEVQAPAGYKLPKTVWLLTVDQNGSTTLKRFLDGENGAYNTVIENGTILTAAANTTMHWVKSWFQGARTDGKITNELKPVKIKKVGTDNPNTGLAGAKFVFADVSKRTDSDGKERYWTAKSDLIKDSAGNIVELTTGPDGMIDLQQVLDNLKTGQGKQVYGADDPKIVLFMFESESPKGYMRNQMPWVITIDGDRKVTIEQHAAPYQVATTVNNEELTAAHLRGTTVGDWSCKFLTINYSSEGVVDSTVDNKPNKILKVDESGNPVAGAKFDIYRATKATTDQGASYEIEKNADGSFKKLNTTTIISGTDGNIDLSMVHDVAMTGSYTYFLLFETEAPEGFNTAPKAPWLVTRNNNTGKITVRANKYPDYDFDQNLGDSGILDNTFEADDKEKNVTIVNSSSNGVLFKAELGKNNNRLEGVKFKLYYATENNGTVTKATGNGSNEYISLESKGNGAITIPFYNNYNGYYLLFEEKTIDGYQRATTPWIIKVSNNEIEKVYQNRQLLAPQDGVTSWSISDCVEKTDKIIENPPLYSLPNSGGIGVYPFTIIGTLMAMIALVMLLGRKEYE